jgi:excisionase family DNA binding protein
MRALTTAGVQSQQRRPGLASVREAEEYLRVSRATIYDLMGKDQLRFVKIGSARRIPWAALEELAEKGTVGA